MSGQEARRCKHCRVEVQLVNYALGPSWRHTPNGDTREHSTYLSCKLTVAEPEPTMLERIMAAMHEAASLPPQPERVRVAPDVAERLRRLASVPSTARPDWPHYAIGRAFGIPVEVDEELPSGEFRVVPGGGA